jgi:hypothetical protein
MGICLALRWSTAIDLGDGKQPKALFDFIGIGDCDGIPSLPFRLGEYSPNLAI